MTDRLRESLSALMDDEANELELQRVLSRMDQDEDLRQAWTRYQLARDALHGQAPSCVDVDISRIVREAIDAQGSSAATKGIKDRLLRPVASLAVAASVAATAVIGGQQIAQLSGTDGSAPPAVAASASPVGLVNSLGATTVQASYGTQALPVLQPAARTAYRELARQRMENYMQQHAEQAVLNSPQGLIPYARVPEIRE